MKTPDHLRSRSDFKNAVPIASADQSIPVLQANGRETLIAEGFGQKIPKGYIYASMAFSVFVEALNIRIRHKKHVEPVHLRESIVASEK
jgi:hypothetical protein